MKVSIVIPTKNGGIALGKCLEAIERQAGNLQKEIIVVDSGSKDDTLRIAREHDARIEQIPAHSFTHGFSRNLGAARSQGDVLVFCNQDVVPANYDWLERLILPLKKGFSASYSRQVPPPGTPYHERVFLRRFYPEQELTHTRATLIRRGAQDIVLFSTVSAAVERATWERLKFDETVIVSEDQEFAYRLLMTGEPIRYQPDSIVYHSNRYTMMSAFRRYFDSGWSMTYPRQLRVRNTGRSFRFMVEMTREMVRDDEASLSEKVDGLNFLACKTIGFGLGQFAPYIPETLRSKISYTKSIVPRAKGDSWNGT